MSLACVTGRFQPVHAQHLELFALALGECDHLVVAVTNPDTSARHEAATSAHRHTPGANPFTYFERVRLLTVALRAAGLAERATVVPFDLTRPELWPQYVPHEARQFVRAYSAWEKEKAARLTEGGYEVVVLDGNPTGKLDATDIRGLLAEADSPEEAWVGSVPPATVPLLRELLADRPMGERR